MNSKPLHMLDVKWLSLGVSKYLTQMVINSCSGLNLANLRGFCDDL